MYKNNTILKRVISLLVAFTIVLPMFPISQFIDILPKTNEVRAAEITGETHQVTISNNVLSNIQTYLETASENPNDLYILNITYNRTTNITGTVTFETDGNVIIRRTSSSAGVRLFTVGNGATFNIGSRDMKGTIKIDGGATYTLNTSMSYDFDTERPYNAGGNGTKNIKTSGGKTYILFSDGENYSDAHWYELGGVTSTTNLIYNNQGTINIYDGATIGNVCSASSATSQTSLNGGAINNYYGTVTMYGGEISWNAIGRSNDGCGAAIYCGPESSSSTTRTTLNLNGGKICNNTALDYSTGSADGGAIAIDSGKLYINGGVITNNRAATGGSDTAADGGAIIARVNAVIYMNDGEISNNFAGGFGGGVLLWNSTLYIYGGTIERNFARYGGGIGMSTSTKSILYMFNDATITKNYADYGGGVCVGSDGYAQNCDFTMFNGNITYNTAEKVGGGICNYNQTNCAANLRSGLISNNKVSEGGKGNGVGIQNQGSGTEYLLYMSGAIVVDTNNDIYINKINNNQVPVKVEGRLTADGSIGMLSVDSWATYANRNIVHFERNDGGILEVQTNKLSIDTDDYLLVENGTHLKLSAATTTTDTFYVARVGDRLYTSLADAIEAVEDGGYVYLINNLTLTKTINIDKTVNLLSETTSSKNAANVIDGAWKDSAGNTITTLETYQPLGDYTIALASTFADDRTNTAGFEIKNGGKLILGDSNVTAETISTTEGGKLTIDGNSGYKINGALFYVASGGELDANYGTTISNNSVNSGYNGAGVDVDGTFNLNGATIKNNITSLSGGGVYVEGTFNFNNGKIEKNESTSNGAGVYVANGGNLYLNNGTIIENKANGADSNGGAIYLENGAYLENKNVIISSNEANLNGAGIYLENGASAKMAGGSIIQNRAVYGNGAGIYNLGILEMTSGSVSGNRIASYNANPLGQGIYSANVLKVEGDLRFSADDIVYLTSGKVIEVTDRILYAKAIPIVTEAEEDGTQIVYINSATDNNALAENLLANKSIYHINDVNIVKSTDGNHLIIGSILVTYNSNNATSGAVPTDDSEYLGGDLVTIIPNTGDLKRTNYTFLGWSTIESTPATSPASEFAIPIYYEKGNELVPGVTYLDELRIYSDLTLYAVWAVDANNNGIPDYREDMLDITVEPSEHGTISSNVTEAQSGTLIMLTTTQDDGYEIKSIEVIYELNGVEEKLTLENGKVVALTESYYYFNMPVESVRIVATFGVQSNNVARVTWLDNNNNEVTEDFINLQLAINEIYARMQNENLRARRLTILRYTYSSTDITIPSGLDFEFDLSNYELDMNSHIFKIENGSKVKLTASSALGKINFNATGGSSGGTGNNLINNGTLIIDSANVITDPGENATEYTIINNGELQVISGKIRHEATKGTAVKNNGTLTVSGGYIFGGTCGIEHSNVTDKIESLTDATSVNHTFNISNLGAANKYGINGDNYISSINLAKDTHINIPSIFENCTDNMIKPENRIPLNLHPTSEVGDVIITSNKLPFMLEHFRMHFNLNDSDNYEIGINNKKQGILIEKIADLETNSAKTTYEYETPIELSATVLDINGDAYVGAKGKVYFFVFDKADEIASWAAIWDEAKNTFREKETTTDGEIIYYTLQDASGYADVDSTTGIAVVKLSNLSLPRSNYAVYGLFVGEDEHSTYSLLIDESTGVTGPLVATTRGAFEVIQKDIANTTITTDTAKSYTGNELEINVEVYDGTNLLEENVDYKVTTNKKLIDADDYVVTIEGIGNYNGQVEKDFVINQYADTVKIEGINAKYIFNDTVPEIKFDDNVLVKDNYSNQLTLNDDYTVEYYKYNQDTDNYELITALSKDVGVYKVVVKGTGTGNYSSTIIQEAAFVIAEDTSASYEVAIQKTILTYNGETRDLSELGEITVTNVNTGAALTKGTDYIVQFGVSTVKNAKEYPVVIQGIGNYSEISLIEHITIRPKEITNANTEVAFAETEFTYNRKAHKPTITSITVEGVNTDSANGGSPLIENTDYIVILSNNTNAGKAKLEITALNGNYTGKAEKEFTINPKNISSNNILASIYQSGYTGAEIISTVTLIDEENSTSKVLVQGNNQDYLVEYVADETANDGAWVNENGYPVNKGTYKAIITGIGNYAGTRTESFVVANYKGKIVANLSPNKYTYLGNSESLESAIKASLQVFRGTDGEELILDKDYVLGYNSPEKTETPSEVGEYVLYIVGIGNYEGTQATAEFAISPLTGSIHIEVDKDVLTYNGKIQTPTVILDRSYLTIDGEKVYLSDLRENIDYIITYTDSLSVGRYMLQINGVGNYAGNYNFYNYTIEPKTLDASDIVIKSAGPISRYYNGSEQTLEISPTGDIWPEYHLEDGSIILLEEGKDFITYYSNNKEAGTATLILMGKGNYQEIKVYTFVIETRSIGLGTIADGFEVTTLEDRAYNGTAIIQDIVLRDVENNKTLEIEKDYTITYLNNIDVGTASVTLTGKGNYSGIINLTFEITLDHTIELMSESVFSYKGYKVEFPVAVKDSLGYMLSDSDFKTEYFVDSACTIKTTPDNSGTDVEGEEPVKAGVYYVKVTGTSVNYNGLTASQKIAITASTSFQLRITNTSNIYDSTNKHASVLVLDSEGEPLLSTEYNVVYYTDANCINKTTLDDGALEVGGAPKNAGKYYVQAEGVGNYAGIKSNAEFVINPRTIESVDVATVGDKYYTGSAIIPKPAVTFMAGEKQVVLIENDDFTYAYNNNTNIGTANITITAAADSRNYTGSKTVTFSIIGEEELRIELANTTLVYTGEEIVINEENVFARNANDELISIADLKLANTNKTYTIVKDTIKNVGTYTIAVEVRENNVLLEKGEAVLEITPKVVIITPDVLSKKYKEENPEYTFTTDIISANANGLLGTDVFEGSLERENGESVGKYGYTIQNLVAENYELTLNDTVKFEIESKDINDTDIIISGVESEYTYTGSEIKPIPQILYPTTVGKITLSNGTDFRVKGYEKKNPDTGNYESVTSPTEVGEYKVTVEGINNYTGTRSFTYIIGALKAFNATITNTTREFNRENQNATVVVTSVTGTLIENVDYKLVYYTDSNYSQKTTLADLSGARSEGGAPSNAGNYYLRVEGIGNYLGSSAEAEFRITPKNINDKTNSNYDIKIADILDMTYTGTEIMPTVSLTWNGVAIGNEDYSVAYKNNTEVGVATITVTGTRNYTGARILNFNIVAITGGTVEITLTDDEGNELTDTTYIYDGTAKEPNVSVTYTPENGVEIPLEENKDYTVKFVEPVQAGTSEVKILLTGNYSGTATTSYKIQPRDLADTEITIIPVSESYTGVAEYPEVNVKYNNVLLTGNRDYTIDYGSTEYLNKGEYTVTVSSTSGNFTGSVEKTYTIKPYGLLEKEYLTLDFVDNNSAFADTTFTQVDLENKLIVKDLNGNTLLPSEYNVLYSADNGTTWSTTSNVTVGSYFVKASGKSTSNYEGSYATATRGYAIYTNDLIADDIVITYDGKTHSITSADLTVRTAANEVLDSSEYEVTFGNIEVKEAGSYTIFITSDKLSPGANSTATYRIEPATFTVGAIEDKTYNGLLEIPEVSVKGIDDAELVEGVDYQLSYSGTTVAGAYYESAKAPVVAGNYVVKITGRANYAGTEEVEYNILPKSLAETGITLTLNNPTSTYNTFTQKAITKIEYAIDGHSIVLVEGVDYEVVSEQEYTDAGKYTIEVQAKQGNYTGTNETTYEILPYTGKLQVEMAGTIFNYGTTIDQITDGLVVEYASETLTEDMYDIYVYPSVSSIPEVGSYTLNVTGKDENYTDGTDGAYGSIKFTIIPASEIIVSFENPEVTYNGLVQKPTEDEIFVEDKSIAEWKQEGKTYEIDYGEGNYKDSASYMVTVSYYEGGILKEQSVAAYRIENADVTITPYSNQEKIYGQIDEPLEYKTSITSGNNGLYENDILNGTLTRVQGEIVGEYEITQKDLIAKNYDIKVTTGIKYKIMPKDLNNSDMMGVSVTGIQNAYTYTGTAIRPRPTITYLSDLYGTLALIENTDYKVSYKYYDEATSSYVETTDDSKLTSVGSYEVVIKGIGNYTGTVKVEYEISAYVTSFTAIISNNYKEYNKMNQAAQVQVTGIDSLLVEGTDYEIVYYTDIACTTPTTLNDKSGALTIGGAPKNVGTYYIQVEGLGNYTGSTTKATFVISAKDISDDEITILPIQEQTYVGENIEPVVTLNWDETVLNRDDYKVEYRNNKEIGRATVTITGIGNYTGTRQIRFNIVPITGGTIEIELLDGTELVDDTTYTYDGEEKKAEVKVTYITNTEEKVLEEDFDYKVAYTNTINAGTVQVTITLIGNYSGTATKSYVINKYDLSNTDMTLIPDSLTYTGTAQKPNVEVKYDNIVLEAGRDYEIEYDGSFVEANSYDVIINAVENSNYTGTNNQTFTIEKYGKATRDTLLLDFKDGNAAYQEMYDQATFENNLSVTDLNRNILSKDDYEVMYSSNGTTWSEELPTIAGVYYVKVVGTGNNYASENDTAQRAFLIYVDKLTANDVEKEYKADTFTINDIISDITLESDEGTILDKDDFTITFGTVEPKNVGKYTIVIMGNNGTDYENLSGTATFEITPATLTIESVTNVTYNGMVQIPEMEVAGIEGDVVEEGRDYTVRYTGTDVKGNAYDNTIPPIVVGTYTVSILGRGNYADSVDTEDYEIGSIGLSDGEFLVELITPQMTYNTAVQKSQVKAYYVTDDYILTLEEGKDFEIEYDSGNYIDVGEYTIYVNALSTSNYSGNTELTFEIIPYVGTLNVTLFEDEFKNGVTADMILEGLEVTYLNDILDSDEYDVTFIPNELTVGNTVLQVSAREDNTNYYLDDTSYAKGFVTFKIVNAEPITIGLVNEEMPYNGKEQKPPFDEIIVRDKTITQWKEFGVTYTVDYGDDDYILPGEYEITVSLYDSDDVLQEEAQITYTITDAVVRVIPNENQSKIFGQLDNELEYKTNINTQTGLYAEDEFTGKLSREKGESVGKYNIVIGSLEAENYEIAFEDDVEFEIIAKQLTNEDIAGISVSGIEATYSYTGDTIAPLPTLTYKNESNDTLALIKDEDYTLSYRKYNEETDEYEDVSEDEMITVGKYKVIIEGINSYTDTVEKEYLITSYVSDFIVTTTNSNKVYNGETQGIELKVKLADGTELVVDEDYEITYYKDIELTTKTTVENGAEAAGAMPSNAGSYYVQVLGIGNYEENQSVITFVISPKDINDITIENVETQEYTGSEITPVPEITYGDITLEKDVDYTLAYANNVNMGTKTASITITAKAGTNYTGSKTIYFSIKMNSTEEFIITLIDENGDEVSDNTYYYDGNEKMPAATVIQGTTTLKDGTDYELSYEDNTNAGEAKVIITLIGFYSGEYERTFKINKKEITEDMISVLEDELKYTGETLVPAIEVSFEIDEKVIYLRNNRDYEVIYPDESVKVGKYEVEIRAKGNNYTGSQTVEFEIVSNLDDLRVIWNADTNMFKRGSKFDEETIKDTFTLKDSEGNVIPANEYKVSFNNPPTKAGTYIMIVTATSENYKDEATGEYAKVRAIFHIDKSSGGGGSEGSGGGSGSGGGGSKDKVTTGIEGNVEEIKVINNDSLLNKEGHVAYINGYSNGTFIPNRNMTRAEAVTIFARLLKDKEIDVKTPTFTDIQDHWAFDSIAIMSELGIVKGYADGTFRPEGNITRAEFATMISRFEIIETMQNKSYFTDIDSKHWAYNTINYSYARGWITGYEDKTFKPNAAITRAEAVTIINRVLERTPDIEYLNNHPELNAYMDINKHWAYYGILEASLAHEHDKTTSKETWEYLWNDEYKIIYYMNDKEGKIYADLDLYKEGKKVKLPTEVNSKTEDKFLGWSLSPEGEVLLLDDYKVSKEDVLNNAVSLYAIWK